MICIPVVAKTQSKALETIKRSAGRADILELRMDFLADGNVKELIRAVHCASHDLKVLVTNRAKEAAASGDEKGRIQVLLDAIAWGADYVDIELAAAPIWKEKIRAAIDKNHNRTALIVSHHDFRKTPSRRTLIGIVNYGIQAGAEVVKIVTLARSPEDNLSVLGLIPYARRSGRDIVAFCMGEHGRISRVAAPLLGSLFTFASLKRGAESAIGQLTVSEMKQISRILEGK
jgi:3-dehydroquinate dehydratase type I